MINVNEIKDIGVFSDLSENNLKKLSKITTKKTYKAKAKIYLSSTRSRRIFIVNNGRVSLRLFDPDGEFELIFGIREKGELFGGASYLKPQKHTVTAVCLKDTELFVIESYDLLKLIDDDFELGYRFMKEIAQIYFDRYVKIENQLTQILKDPTIIKAHSRIFF